MRNNRVNMRSANWLVIFLAFLGADDTAGGFFQLDVDQSGANSTDMLIGDASLGIDEEAFGNAPDPVVHGYLSGFVPAVGIRDVEFLKKGTRVFLLVLDGNAEKDQVFVLEALPSGFEILRLRAAGDTPGGPKIQKDRLAAQIVEADFAAIEKSDSERRRCFGQQRRSDVVGIPREAEGKQPQDRRDEQDCNEESPPSHLTLLPGKSFPAAGLQAGYRGQ
jgi:hypothetical protein